MWMSRIIKKKRSLLGLHGGSADTQVASIQLFCLEIKRQKALKAFLLFVQLLIYSIASHRVNPAPLPSITQTFAHSWGGFIIFLVCCVKKIYKYKNHLVNMSCSSSWMLGKRIICRPFASVSGSSSKLFAVINLAKLIRAFVTHLSTPLTLINSARSPNVSLSLLFFPPTFLSELSRQSLPHHSSSTDVGRIPNFILFLSACQFWKGGKQDRK